MTPSKPARILKPATVQTSPFACSRRTFLSRSSVGLGSAALISLLGAGKAAPVHFAPRARRVIFLCMAGGPSQFETFDFKPALARLDGQPMPTSYTQGQPIAQLQGHELRCLGPRFPFQRSGKCGTEMTTLFPHLGAVADELCVVRSMQTDQINHDPAHTVMNTGTSISGRPSMGSWVTYGLGSETDELPGFVVLTSQGGRNPQPIAARQWHSGFLPAEHQGVELYPGPEPLHYLLDPAGVDRQRQRELIDTVQALNRSRLGSLPDPEVEARIRQYELAFRLQASVPGLLDLASEPKHVLEMYGTNGRDGSFASNCLLARRLAERGVRFIQLYHRGWDHHNGLDDFMKVCAGLVDRASAALVQDLKQRGMLDDTLIIWGGEFGRTPMAQTNKGKVGRDHHMRGFSMWLAGGGVRGGLTHGATDELGYAAVTDRVHVHDLHATMLHLLGLDHERLTYRYQGRDFRLTDVSGRVVREILA